MIYKFILGAALTVFTATSATAQDNTLVPDEAAAFAFLQDGAYKDWPHEQEQHKSVGPHRNFGWPVQVYYNPLIAESLQAGNDTHPQGSAVVKEMYSKDGSEIVGWAVMIKNNADSNGGKGWWWYEPLADGMALGGTPGNGIGVCTGCHAAGNDMVLSTEAFE